MLFAAYCEDAPNAPELRKKFVQEHLAYIKEIMDSVAVAGPLLDKAGEHGGSLLVYETTSEEQAMQLLAKDPYYRAGVWKSCSLKPFRAAAGRWVGGQNW